MKVLYIAAECKPFSKAGGVGDVTGELPPALKRAGVDIEIVTPWYGSIELADARVDFHGQEEPVGAIPAELDGVPINFIKNAHYFEGDYGAPYITSEHIPFYDDIIRFSFFSEACLHLIERKKPDIVHVHDWPLGYLLARMRMTGQRAKRLLTVHNIGYQGTIGVESIRDWHIESILRDPEVGPSFVDPRPDWQSVNALRLGLECAHGANTVSPTYKQEITQPEDPDRYFEGGKGLHEVAAGLDRAGRLSGILNGFNYAFDPTDQRFAEVLEQKAAAKQALAADFAQPEHMLIGFVGRAVEQKFKLLTEEVDGKSALAHILDLPGVNVAILGTGLPEYEEFLRSFEGRPNYSATIAFDRAKAAQISLGSDLFLMPSLFEPCGITQMESLANATPPLVRWTGGLVDTVVPHTEAAGTGFGFDGATRAAVLHNLIESVRAARAMYGSEAFAGLQRRGFGARFLWADAAQQYVDELYEPILKRG